MKFWLILLSMGSILIASAQTDSTAPIICYVERMPEYPGGEKALVEFVRSNVNYIECDTMGKVIVGFTVSETGDVIDIRIRKGLCAALDNEAMRVIAMLDCFKPGAQMGKPVRTTYSLPITISRPTGN